MYVSIGVRFNFEVLPLSVGFVVWKMLATHEVNLISNVSGHFTKLEHIIAIRLRVN
jgi:hypothetical protein